MRKILALLIVVLFAPLAHAQQTMITVGASLVPNYIAGNWYLPSPSAFYTTGTNPGIGSIRLFPAFIRQTFTISSLGLRVSAGSAGNAQAAIYANNPATGRPTGTPLASTASMTTASAAAVASAVSVQLTPGLYWFASNIDNGTATLTTMQTTNGIQGEIVGSATQSNILGGGGGNLNGLSTPSTFNTWGDLTAATFTEVTATTTIPVVEFKIGSIP